MKVYVVVADEWTEGIQDDQAQNNVKGIYETLAKARTKLREMWDELIDMIGVGDLERDGEIVRHVDETPDGYCVMTGEGATYYSGRIEEWEVL